jgi:hypothetical protein
MSSKAAINQGSSEDHFSQLMNKWSHDSREQNYNKKGVEPLENQPQIKVEEVITKPKVQEKFQVSLFKSIDKVYEESKIEETPYPETEAYLST